MSLNNESNQNNLKIAVPKSPMCLDIIDTSSPTSNISLSPLSPTLMKENNPIVIFQKTHYYNIHELSEFDIVGNWFKNVIVDELDMKQHKKSKNK